MLSDSPFLPTGYANQSREFARRLAQENDYNVRYLGAQYSGMPIYADFEKGLTSTQTTRGLPEIIGNWGAQYGQDSLPFYVQKYRPDLVWCLLDTFMVHYLLNINLHPTKFLMYYPSDGDQLPAWSDALLKKVDVAVAMSKYAQKQATDLGINAKYIPHAVDEHKFYSLASAKEQLRLQWSKRMNYPLNGKFIVGCVARNQGRKVLERLLTAFAIFSQNKDDAVLVLHTDPNDGARVVDLPAYANRLGIGHKVVFTPFHVFNPATERELLEIYNLFDVFALPTTGEGFGIPIVEAMACEKPVIVTNYTTTKELVVDHNAGLPSNLATKVVGTYNVDRGFVDETHMAEQMQYLYDNPAERKKMGSNGREAVLKNYTWKKTFPQWLNLLDEVLD